MNDNGASQLRSAQGRLTSHQAFDQWMAEQWQDYMLENGLMGHEDQVSFGFHGKNGKTLGYVTKDACGKQ